MAPVLYYTDLSPPSRAVLLLAKAINLTLTMKEVNLLTFDHFKPEFVKINPQRTIPVLNDNGFILSDSHAINIYLISTYAKNDNLYPQDIKTRALINQRLHFDSGVAFSLLLRIGKPLRMKQMRTIPENLKAEIREVYEYLETILEGNKWMCGNFVTLADIHLIATISSIQFFEHLTDRHPNIKKWLNNCEKELWYEANIKGLNDFNNILRRY